MFSSDMITSIITSRRYWRIVLPCLDKTNDDEPPSNGSFIRLMMNAFRVASPPWSNDLVRWLVSPCIEKACSSSRARDSLKKSSKSMKNCALMGAREAVDCDDDREWDMITVFRKMNEMVFARDAS